MNPLVWSAFFLFLLTFSPASTEAKVIHVLAYEGIINPVSSELIVGAIQKAEQAEAEALIVEIDTPGGLDLSMRDIVKAMIASEVPIIIYVAPSGGRAASAGVFIAFAAHLSAMAPGTNIGAAHPVAMGGQKVDEEMRKKLENDASAYIRSLAERQGRNGVWAEDAVRNSVSITEKEALEKNVVDLIAEDLPDLIKKIDGRTVVTVKGEHLLSTLDAEIVRNPISLRIRILKAISDPNVAYILMLLGTTGLIAELYSPGAIFPGVVGAICLILAFFAFQTLPINYAGLLLIIFAIALFIAELVVQSFGILAMGAVASLLFGSLMLIESDIPSLRISLPVILTTTAVTALFFIVVLRAALKAQGTPSQTGSSQLVGEIGVAQADLSPGGPFRLQGEIWQAESEEAIRAGEEAKVIEVVGLKLKVKKVIKS
ncbi:MAG: nodulation protein NfeD [Nitrospiria bacterium]